MRARALIAVVVGAASLAACGPKAKLDVDLRGVSITVPRLLTPALDLVPAPAAPVAADLPPVPDVVDLLKPVPKPSAPACGAADAFAVPEKPASQVLSLAPAADTFVQAADGAFSSRDGSGSLAGPVATVVSRLPSSATSAGQDVDAWAVLRTDAARKATSVEVYQLVHPSASPLATASGIYLVGLAWDDPSRGKLVFQPVGSGLFILPNPVQQAINTVQYAGAATDPVNLTTIALVRNVRGRERVDACGALIDTFTVDMTATVTSRDVQRQITWTQRLATQYGGLSVQETFTMNSVVEGFNWTRTLRNTALPKDPAQ